MATHVAVANVVIQTNQGTVTVASKVFSAENRHRAKALADGYIKELTGAVEVISAGQIVAPVNGGLKTVMSVQGMLQMFGIRGVGFSVMEAEATETDLALPPERKIEIARG